jgi:Ca2+-binding EF-hand superfamily protein
MIQPHEHQQAAQWFYSVDHDRSGSISGTELAGIQFNGTPIGPQVGFKLIKVFDRDNSGTIDLREYSILHKFLTLMQNAFMSNDQGRQGKLQPQQIFTAIQSSGFQVSLPTIQAMAKKFDPTNTGITFSTYLWICSHLAHARSIFEWNDRARTGNINLTYDALAHIATEIL